MLCKFNIYHLFWDIKVFDIDISKRDIGKNKLIFLLHRTTFNENVSEPKKKYKGETLQTIKDELGIK